MMLFCVFQIFLFRKRLQKLQRYTATPNEYLVIKENTGLVTHKPGYAQNLALYRNDKNLNQNEFDFLKKSGIFLYFMQYDDICDVTCQNRLLSLK